LHDPITLNHYAYAGADPVDNTDPQGHDFAETLATIGIGINLVSFSFNYLGALYAQSRGNSAVALNRLNWALVDLLFLWLPFSGGGTSVKLGYEVLLVTATSLSRSGVAVSAIRGYLVGLAAVLPGLSESLMSADAGGISPVERPAVPKQELRDPNGDPVTIYGQTGSSSTTNGHPEAMVQKAQEMVSSGKYRYIFFQRAWRTATGRLSESGLIPDILGVTRDGKVDAFEVLSNTDTRSALLERLQGGMDSLPEEIKGIYDVIPPLAK
jgi:hypothetical protein